MMVTTSADVSRTIFARAFLIMCFFALTICAVILSSCSAHAQSATCPNYSQRAIKHPSTETTYTIQITDQCAKLVFLNTGAEVVNLPNPGAFFPAGFKVDLAAVGSGGITLTPTSPVTITGGSTTAGSTLAKAQGTACGLATDGTNWYC